MMIEAYHRCGIFRPTISGDQIDDAIRSANFILIDYNNRGSNLYSIQTEIIGITQGLPSYSVPDFYEINDVTMASFRRQLGNSNNLGVAATNAGGEASLAFDGNPTTSCQNTTPNGQITFSFTTKPALVQFVGIQTAQSDNQTYNLQFFYQSIPNNPATKQIVYTTGPFTPFPNQPYYFFLNPCQTAGTWGVEEIGGATLNLAEVFFSEYNISRTLSSLSRQDWMTLSNKNLGNNSSVDYGPNYQLIRQLGSPSNPGTPATDAGGNAALAFDGNPNTSCLNTSANGQITYSFAVSAVPVQIVGFQTAVGDTQTYHLQFFVQTNPFDPTTKRIIYDTGVIVPQENKVYYYTLNTAQSSQIFGIQEIGGATLNMAEVFFDQQRNLQPWPPQPPANAWPPSPVIPSSSTGFPSGYYVDRQPTPVINFYPIPDLSYPFCVFTYTSYFESLTSLQQVLKIPGSFIPAITAELAMALATKYAPDKLPYLTAQSDKAFLYATNEDRQKVKFKIQLDFGQFNTN